MRIAIIASALAAAATAQNHALIKVWTYQLRQSDNPMDVLFADAFDSLVDEYVANDAPFPQHVIDTVVANLASGGGDRAGPFCPQPGGCMAAISLQNIWSYGCWCDLDNPTVGSGTPMDEYDSACMNMVKCNQCAEIDGEEDACDAITSPYTARISYNFMARGWDYDCSTGNTNACAEHLCSCEGTFITDVLNLLFDGVQRNLEYNTDSPNYGDHSDQCVAAASASEGDFDGFTGAGGSSNTGGSTTDGSSDDGNGGGAGSSSPNPGFQPGFVTGNSDSSANTGAAGATVTTGTEQCCGLYPTRKKMSSGQGCCVDTNISNVFSSTTEECCDDGTTATLGECG